MIVDQTIITKCESCGVGIVNINDVRIRVDGMIAFLCNECFRQKEMNHVDAITAPNTENFHQR